MYFKKVIFSDRDGNILLENPSVEAQRCEVEEIVLSQIVCAIKCGQRIAAIKLIRDLFDLSLRDAKLISDMMIALNDPKDVDF